MAGLTLRGPDVPAWAAEGREGRSQGLQLEVRPLRGPYTSSLSIFLIKDTTIPGKIDKYSWKNYEYSRWRDLFLFFSTAPSFPTHVNLSQNWGRCTYGWRWRWQWWWWLWWSRGSGWPCGSIFQIRRSRVRTVYLVWLFSGYFPPNFTFEYFQTKHLTLSDSLQILLQLLLETHWHGKSKKLLKSL